MPSLAETQLRLRRAVVTGDTAGVLPLLVGGRHPEKRLAIHRRHYETSLATTLFQTFPATAWLVGASFITEAARRFVREHPPQAPCIAEYGEDFPQFLSTCPAAGRVPYLSGFAELEWHLGCVALAVDGPALAFEDFRKVDVEALMDARLTLQPGLRYLHAPWPIDDLMRLYLTDTAPDRLSFAPAEVWVEVCGARGEFHIDRLDAGEFVFRKTVQAGRSIGDAAECALDANSAFDPGPALAALFARRLVTAVTPGVAKEP